MANQNHDSVPLRNVVYEFTCECDTCYVDKSSKRLVDWMRQHVPLAIINVLLQESTVFFLQITVFLLSLYVLYEESVIQGYLQIFTINYLFIHSRRFKYLILCDVLSSLR